MAGCDVVGLPVAEARLRLAEAGYADIEEVVTQSPRRPVLDGCQRVVRVRQAPGRLELVIASFPTLGRAEVK